MDALYSSMSSAGQRPQRPAPPFDSSARALRRAAKAVGQAYARFQDAQPDAEGRWALLTAATWPTGRKLVLGARKVTGGTSSVEADALVTALIGLSDAITHGFAATTNQMRLWEAMSAVSDTSVEALVYALASLIDVERFHREPTLAPPRPIAQLVQTLATILYELTYVLARPTQAQGPGDGFLAYFEFIHAAFDVGLVRRYAELALPAYPGEQAGTADLGTMAEPTVHEMRETVERFLQVIDPYEATALMAAGFLGVVARSSLGLVADMQASSRHVLSQLPPAIAAKIGTQGAISMTSVTSFASVRILTLVEERLRSGTGVRRAALRNGGRETVRDTLAALRLQRAETTGSATTGVETSIALWQKIDHHLARLCDNPRCVKLPVGSAMSACSRCRVARCA